MANPFLSIIFPAHNEEHRLPSALESTLAFFDAQPFSGEVVVVENGSSDKTLSIAQSFAQKDPRVIVIHEQDRGKGRAVKSGMLAANGDYRFACDVDLSMPLDQVTRFIPPALNEDVIIASRETSGAKRYNEPEYRHLIGRVFNLLVRILALPGIQDSQCGFKCFSRKAALELFPLQTIMGWTLDVEILYIARKRGYRIVELGIPWYHDPHSKVKVFRDSFRMILDLIQIRWNNILGRYAKPRA